MKEKDGVLVNFCKLNTSEHCREFKEKYENRAKANTNNRIFYVLVDGSEERVIQEIGDTYLIQMVPSVIFFLKDEKIA